MISTYAQNFEDVLLSRVFKSRSSGFYIDVGAHDPEDMSVTKHFYDMGWSGINIEPVPENYRRFNEKRPRDINLNIALGSEPGSAVIYVPAGSTAYVSDASALSSLDRVTAEEAAQLLGTGTVTETEIRVSTLTDVCREHCRGSIEFLKIDVEGWERQVLQGANFEQYRPVVVVMEALKPNAAVSDVFTIDSFAAWQDWEHLLLNAGYLFAYFDGLNRFYLREEDENLRGAFRVPVGIYDDVRFTNPLRIARSLREKIIKPELDRVRRAEELSAELLKENAERQSVLNSMSRDRLRLHDKVTELQVIRENLQSQLDVLRNQHDWDAREVARLNSALADSRQTNADFQDRLRKLSERQLQLELENATLRESADAFEAWGDQLKRQGERLVEDHADWCRTKQALQIERSSLSLENARLTAELESLKSQFRLLQDVFREKEFREQNRIQLTLQRYVPMLALLLRRLIPTIMPPVMPVEEVASSTNQTTEKSGESWAESPSLVPWPAKPSPPLKNFAA